ELDQGRIERHERDGSPIARKHVDGAFGQSSVAIKMAFELEQQCYPSSNKIAQFCQCKDAPGAGFETNRFDLSSAHLSETPAGVSQATEHIIVVYHGFAVCADLQIGLDSVVGCYGCCKGGSRVFDDSVRFVMQTAVSDWSRREPFEAGHWKIRKPQKGLRPLLQHPPATQRRQPSRAHGGLCPRIPLPSGPRRHS